MSIFFLVVREKYLNSGCMTRLSRTRFPKCTLYVLRSWHGGMIQFDAGTDFR